MRSRASAILRLACCAVAATQLASAAPKPGDIGLEKDYPITLDRGDYQPRALDDRTPIILRLEKIQPEKDGRFTYIFHPIGFEPGSYKLADYLVHPDGTPATEIGDARIDIGSLLPPDHMGILNRFEPRPFPFFGGYRMMLGGLAVLWLCGLPALIWLGRKKKVVDTGEVAPPAPSYAERMRPLVEAAAAGTLTATGQAELERLMSGYWREKIATPDQHMTEALAALKRHPEAGSLLRAMERWLHHPGGASKQEIDALLEPYLTMAVESGVAA
ncbi:hypothetical protein KBB96_07545 [Luteolibacter ambystomatis]|uniref:Protein BatD n=1 Tax=Luteolibacter ambystomatis TaxID=2824561 RepID=A0A975PGX0_9BACT|nr:hypothetical protein [Luteolibacter ambystomatis]QUE52737.1 hypothetical protein KBB96_07545 [Luteolibacter ambystomatis]